MTAQSTESTSTDSTRARNAKRRVSRNPAKAAKQRAAWKAAAEYKRDRTRVLYGSQGAAGPARHIPSPEGEAGET